MKLNSVSFYEHKVLGSIKINLFGDSEPLNSGFFENHYCNILIEKGATDSNNFYTYIIGQNGVGKSVLFRSIIHFININNRVPDPKVTEIIKLYPLSKKYIKFLQSDEALYELAKFGIYNYSSHQEANPIADFLANNEAQLIFITSSFEKSVVHSNPRFRSFNYLSEINKTKFIFLRALRKFSISKEINILNKLLDKKSSPFWHVQCGVVVKGYELEENGNTIVINTPLEDIGNFIELLGKIKISDGELLRAELTPQEILIFETIYNSGMFFKVFFDSNLSASEFFDKVKTGFIVDRIRKVIKGESFEEEQFQEMKFDQKYGIVNFLASKPDVLSEFDYFVLFLLDSLHLINVDIYCDGISIDSMSSGEQSIIRLFSFFSDLPIPEGKKNIIVFFDEPENTLHPKWQQDFPENFKTIVETIYQIENSHFIFTTHSPLIIMKSATINNTNALSFSKDKNECFISRKINDIDSYCIEEVMLDEFKVIYRGQDLENRVKKILLDRNSDVLNNDPIFSIEKSFDLKNRIDILYSKILKKE